MSGNCLYTFQKDDLLHKIRIYDLKTTLTRCKVDNLSALLSVFE